MIKVGITEADSELAGELIRILLNHPDVDIVAAYSPSKAGIAMHDHHHGMIGETTINFSDRINLEDIDIIFICGDSEFSKSIIENRNSYPELKIIDLTNYALTSKLEDFCCGISELNRKELVREANRVYILPPVATISAVGLYPLGANLLLNSDIDANVQIPKSFLEQFNPENDALVLNDLLKQIQKSFSSRIRFTSSPSPSRRGIRISLQLPISTDLGNIMSIYDGIYDDHNFAFITNRKLELKEVVGTHKILITLIKNEKDSLEVDIIADYLMRGAAGEAVHVMNLLFGLHERTGLSLKASSV